MGMIPGYQKTGVRQAHRSDAGSPVSHTPTQTANGLPTLLVYSGSLFIKQPAGQDVEISTPIDWRC